MIVLAASDQLKEGSYLRHSVFNRVVNFSSLDDSKKLMSFAKEGMPLSANQLIVDEHLFALLATSENIHINTDSFQIDDQEYLLPEKRFSSQVPILPIEQSLFDQKIDQLVTLVTKLNRPSSLLELMQEHEIQSNSSFHKAMIQHFKDHIAKWDTKSNLVSTIQQLKGVGIGLTPSGDDFVNGVLAALFLIEAQYEKQLSLEKEQIYNASKTENPYSKTFLENTFQGLFNSHIHNLFQSIMTDQPLLSPLNDILSHGETSGADWLTGFTLTLQRRTIWLQKE